MCRCCCNCNKQEKSNESKFNDFLDCHREITREKQIRKEFLMNNIPFIINLVNKYNEESNKRPDKAVDALKQNQALSDLVERIIIHIW